MNYQAFTNASLTMMYEGIRGALAADEAMKGRGEEAKFRIRETADWKQHAGNLESEMLRRGMFFDVIDWSEDILTELISDADRRKGTVPARPNFPVRTVPEPAASGQEIRDVHGAGLGEVNPRTAVSADLPTNR